MSSWRLYTFQQGGLWRARIDSVNGRIHKQCEPQSTKDAAYRALLELCTQEFGIVSITEIDADPRSKVKIGQ